LTGGDFGPHPSPDGRQVGVKPIPGPIGDVEDAQGPLRHLGEAMVLSEGQGSHAEHGAHREQRGKSVSGMGAHGRAETAPFMVQG